LRAERLKAMKTIAQIGAVALFLLVTVPPLLASLGWFRKCASCGSRLTIGEREVSPDHSVGSERMHVRQTQSCLRCKHVQAREVV